MSEIIMMQLRIFQVYWNKGHLNLSGNKINSIVDISKFRLFQNLVYCHRIAKFCKCEITLF